MIRAILLSLLLMIQASFAYADGVSLSPPAGLAPSDQMQFSILEVTIKALGGDRETTALSPDFSLAPRLIPQTANKNVPLCLGTYDTSLKKGEISPAVLQQLIEAHRERILKPLKDCSDSQVVYVFVGLSRTCQESERVPSTGDYWAAIIDNGKQEGLAACFIANAPAGKIDIKGVAAVVTASFIMKRF
jgi:hypothetical protein